VRLIVRKVKGSFVVERYVESLDSRPALSACLVLSCYS
jgi:hypothetical protein